MEKAVHLAGPGMLRLAKDYSRVYYGTEFCQNLIPSPDELKVMLCATGAKGKKLTLLTPYVTDRGLERLRPLFKYLDKQESRTEVVFNDWGVLKLLSDEYGNLEPVLGRLLTKQRRDPRAAAALLNTQRAQKKFDAETGTTNILIPKENPASLYEHFRGSVVNAPIFREFLLARGIRRVEIDNLAWDMKVETGKRIGVSIYLPYAYVTTTRLCGLLTMSYAACRKECRKYFLSFKSPSSPYPFFIRGNTVFYKSKTPTQRYLRERGVDRIICNGEK
jgi:hypothetical protein